MNVVAAAVEQSSYLSGSFSAPSVQRVDLVASIALLPVSIQRCQIRARLPSASLHAFSPRKSADVGWREDEGEIRLGREPVAAAQHLLNVAMSFSQRAAVMVSGLWCPATCSLADLLPLGLLQVDDQERALQKQARRAHKAAQQAAQSVQAQFSVGSPIPRRPLRRPKLTSPAPQTSHPYSLGKHPSGGSEWQLFTAQHMREIAALDMGIVAGAVGVEAWRKASEAIDGRHGELPPPASISRRTYGRYFR